MRTPDESRAAGARHHRENDPIDRIAPWLRWTMEESQCFFVDTGQGARSCSRNVATHFRRFEDHPRKRSLIALVVVAACSSPLQSHPAPTIATCCR